MLIFDLVRTLLKSRNLVEATIKTQKIFYKQEKKLNPNQDPHYWLTSTYLSRYGKKINTTKDSIDNYTLDARLSTMIYSCIPEPNNTKALALYMLYKEQSKVLKKNPKYIQEYNDLCNMLLDLQINSTKKFYKIYKKIILLAPLSSVSNTN